MDMTLQVLRAAKSTPYVLDQFLPEFWERTFHPHLGLLGTIRYRFKSSTLTSISNARLRLRYDTDTRFEAVVEDRFRVMNAMLNVKDVPVQELWQVVTEPLAKQLPLRMNKPRSNIPIFRVVGLSERPQLVQSRIFRLPLPNSAEVINFSQITMRLVTDQSPVKVEQKYPVDPVPLLDRKAYLPAARPRDGRVYYYDPKSDDRTYRPVVERFSAFPLLDASRGTFGNSGRVIGIDRDKKLYTVENFVVMERRLIDPQTKWRIHLF